MILKHHRKLTITVHEHISTSKQEWIGKPLVFTLLGQSYGTAIDRLKAMGWCYEQSLQTRMKV